jgi:hypothetical protein
MASDTQVVTVEEDPQPTALEKSAGFVHIVDPQCRNLRFAPFDGGAENWIELRQNIPPEWPGSTPDELLATIPGEALVAPDHPALPLYRELHGKHARINELKVKPANVKDEQIQKKAEKAR